MALNKPQPVFLWPGVYRVGCGVTVPHIQRGSSPSYTPEAHAARIEGNVELLIVIGEDGTASVIEVQKSLGYGLDEKAIECVKRWRFTPGTLQGKPVPVGANTTVHFEWKPRLLR